MSEENPAAAAATGDGAAVSIWSWRGAIGGPLRILGSGLYFIAEYIGEQVASLIGLNESKFQYVIDSMSEEDWEVARQVHAQREARKAQESVEAVMEGGTPGQQGVPLENPTRSFLVVKEEEARKAALSR